MMSTPTAIHLHKQSATLEVAFADGVSAHLPAEFLRVHSPSAEVQGHGKPILQLGKQNVRITHIEAVGNYALKIVFDDGHDSGLYSWTLLHKFALEQDALWARYQKRIKQAES
ncbi:gamma-butyrobetaine hydroxylase-like domain-containing protein [Salinispirillum marinum]|uniref:Gamma-butyrobetaine hydroxylase-like domain-containing protein n=2 Tax=Saccharospirillaceae TaxID=255527 RepID=A0ABV8BJR3_9GAMM